MVSGYDIVRDGIERVSRLPRKHDGDALTGIGPSHSPRDPLLAKMPDGLIHVFIKKRPGELAVMPPIGDALQAEWNTVNGGAGDEVYLNLSCRSEALWPTFQSLVSEMIDRMSVSGRAAMEEFRSVLDSWREALERARREANQSSITGLFGELATLVRVANVRRDALVLWKGKSGHYHDFALSNALEVKTYRSHNAPEVTIHGSRQLDPPVGGQLHLLALQIEPSERGSSIADLHRELVKLNIDSTEVRAHLDSPLLAESTLQDRFVVADERLFLVDDAFPGVRASRLDAQSLRGISNLTYRLALDACPNQLDVSLIDEVIANL